MRTYDEALNEITTAIRWAADNSDISVVNEYEECYYTFDEMCDLIDEAIEEHLELKGFEEINAEFEASEDPLDRGDLDDFIREVAEEMFNEYALDNDPGALNY